MSSASSSSSLSLQTKVPIAPNVSMPIFGLGTWRSDKGEIKEIVKKSLALGYPHLDCAFLYLNQAEIGEGLSEVFSGKIKREDIFITSKVWNHHHSAENVVKSTQSTLKDLRVDYLDLQLIHWPTAWESEEPLPKEKKDAKVTMEETWKAMEGLVEKGLVKSIGVSNFQIHEIDEILKFAKIKPAVNQVEMHPYFNQDKLRAYCKEKGIHITAYCPLGNLGDVNEPALTRQKELAKQFNVDPKDFIPLKDEVITAMAKKKGKSPAQIVIRWSLQHGTTVIPKTIKEERLKENMSVFDFELTAEEMKEIDALGDKKNLRYVSPPFRNNGTVNVFPPDHKSH